MLNPHTNMATADQIIRLVEILGEDEARVLIWRLLTPANEVDRMLADSQMLFWLEDANEDEDEDNEDEDEDNVAEYIWQEDETNENEDEDEDEEDEEDEDEEDNVAEYNTEDETDETDEEDLDPELEQPLLTQTVQPYILDNNGQATFVTVLYLNGQEYTMLSDNTLLYNGVQVGMVTNTGNIILF